MNMYLLYLVTTNFETVFVWAKQDTELNEIVFCQLFANVVFPIMLFLHLMSNDLLRVTKSALYCTSVLLWKTIIVAHLWIVCN